MMYLGLSVISSALITLVMRFGEGRMKNRMGMFVINYAVCAALAFLYWKADAAAGTAVEIGTGPSDGRTFALWFGLISGGLYLYSLTLMQQNIKANGVVLAGTFTKMGVLVPTLAAVTVFHETPRIMQLVGFALAALAIVLMNGGKEGKQKAGSRGLLLLLLVVSGSVNTLVKVFEKWGVREYKDLYLVCTFGVAGLCALALWRKNEGHLCKWDLIIGACLGVPNYLASRFLLLALHQVPAVVAYPVSSVGTLVVITLVGVFFFKEKLSKRKTWALGIILLSLILLNL